MKAKFLTALFAAIILVGCSSDDENTPPVGNDTNYFPLTKDNSWTYNNESQSQGLPPTQSTETLRVMDSTGRNGTTHYDLESDQPTEGGAVTTLLAQGELSKTETELIYNGNFAINIGQMGIEDLVFPIENAVVFSTTANAGTELFSFSGEITQQIMIEGQSVPVTIKYTVSTTNLGVLESHTVGGEKFQDVLSSNLVVSASASVPFGPIDLQVLTPQEVFSATNYYANNVGMIDSDVTIAYEFEDLSEYGFQNVPPVNIQSTQEIESYVIVE